MAFCNKCGAEIPDDSVFCPKCGTKMEAEEQAPPSNPVCASCGQELAPDSQFCNKCGTPVAQAQQNTPPPESFCASCGEKLTPESQFCNKCGTPVAQAQSNTPLSEPVCPACGAEFEPGDKFCLNCGQALDSVAPVADEITGEIKARIFAFKDERAAAEYEAAERCLSSVYVNNSGGIVGKDMLDKGKAHLVIARSYEPDNPCLCAVQTDISLAFGYGSKSEIDYTEIERMYQLFPENYMVLLALISKKTKFSKPVLPNPEFDQIVMYYTKAVDVFMQSPPEVQTFYENYRCLCQFSLSRVLFGQVEWYCFNRKDTVALDTLKEAHSRYPEDTLYLHYLEQIGHHLEEREPLPRAYIEEVEEGYKKILEINPNDARALFKYAQFLYMKKQRDESTKYFKKVLEIHPNSRYGIRAKQALEGGCFITTAVCDSLSKPDDCRELEAFRAFRDGWLAEQEDGAALIARYYRTAPLIVEQINKMPDRERIYAGIWERHLSVCLKFIEQGRFTECKAGYVDMVTALEKAYL